MLQVRRPRVRVRVRVLVLSQVRARVRLVLVQLQSTPLHEDVAFAARQWPTSSAIYATARFEQLLKPQTYLEHADLFCLAQPQGPVPLHAGNPVLLKTVRERYSEYKTAFTQWYKAGSSLDAGVRSCVGGIDCEGTKLDFAGVAINAELDRLGTQFKTSQRLVSSMSACEITTHSVLPVCIVMSDGHQPLASDEEAAAAASAFVLETREHGFLVPPMVTVAIDCGPHGGVDSSTSTSSSRDDFAAARAAVGAGSGAGAAGAGAGAAGDRNGSSRSSHVGAGSGSGSGSGSGGGSSESKSASSIMQDGPTRGQSGSSAKSAAASGSERRSHGSAVQTGQHGLPGHSYHEQLAAIAGVGRTNPTVMMSPAAGHDLHSVKVEFVEAVRSALRRTVWVKHTNRLTDENMHISYLGLTPVCVLAPGQSATILLSPADAAEPLDSPASAFRITYSPFRRDAETARQQARARLKLQAKQAAARATWTAAEWDRKRKQQQRQQQHQQLREPTSRGSGSGSGSGPGSNKGTKRKLESTPLATIDEGSEPQQSSPQHKRRRTQDPGPGKDS